MHSTTISALALVLLSSASSLNAFYLPRDIDNEVASLYARQVLEQVYPRGFYEDGVQARDPVYMQDRHSYESQRLYNRDPNFLTNAVHTVAKDAGSIASKASGFVSKHEKVFKPLEKVAKVGMNVAPMLLMAREPELSDSEIFVRGFEDGLEARDLQDEYLEMLLM